LLNEFLAFLKHGSEPKFIDVPGRLERYLFARRYRFRGQAAPQHTEHFLENLFLRMFRTQGFCINPNKEF
jgi:hypothetical protein